MAVQAIRIRHSTGWGYRTAVTYYNRSSLCCVVLYCTTECCMNTIFKYYMLMSALQTLRRESDSGRRKGSTSYPILSYRILLSYNSTLCRSVLYLVFVACHSVRPCPSHSRHPYANSTSPSPSPSVSPSASPSVSVSEPALS